jgi:hypothetical protein
MGLLVMDEVEKTEDRRFVQRLHDYCENKNFPELWHRMCARPLHAPEMKKETMLLSPLHSRRAKVTRSRVSAANKPHPWFVSKSLI